MIFHKIGIATDVANKVNAKTLILNHFSQRYKPVNYEKEKKENNNSVQNNENNEDDIEDNVQKLIDEAKLTFSGNILAAYDLFTFRVI